MKVIDTISFKDGFIHREIVDEDEKPDLTTLIDFYVRQLLEKEKEDVAT